MKKQNIIWFVADQMRKDALGCYGNEASNTKNMDCLANEGIRFNNAYCQNPVCVPSRCSFLTGLYPHTTGHRTMHYLQSADEDNILKVMKQAGYEVIWVGKNDVLKKDVDLTQYCDIAIPMERVDFMKKLIEKKPIAPLYSFYWGTYHDEDRLSNPDDVMIDKLLSYLQTRKSDKPFFLYCNLYVPHPPYLCEEREYLQVKRDCLPQRIGNIETLHGKAKMLNEIRKKQNLQEQEHYFEDIRCTYLGMVQHADDLLGRLCTCLKDLGVYAETSLFVFSDHGDYTTDYGIVEKAQNCFEDVITNVPLIVKPADGIQVCCAESEALVELLDLPATICEMVGVELPYTQFGKSLLPVIQSKKEHKDAVFCEGGRLFGEVQAMERGHNETSPYWPRLSTQEHDDVAHSKACMIRMDHYKYIMRLYDMDEFYDLSIDQDETRNRIDDPTYQQEIQTMKNRMLKYYMETSDTVPSKVDKR